MKNVKHHCCVAEHDLTKINVEHPLHTKRLVNQRTAVGDIFAIEVQTDGKPTDLCILLDNTQ